MLQRQNKFSLSNILIALSVFFTWLSYVFPWIYIFGMNSYFFESWNYAYWFLQFFSSNFIHWGITHLFMNAIFIFYFWNLLEIKIWFKKMLLFFITNAIFVWVILTFFAKWSTIWISGFSLALLTAYTLWLWKQNNPEYGWWITAIVINILIGLFPGISLLGHLFWMVFGVIFWCIAIRK